MNNLTCPICGGQKSTKVSNNEYRCEYCGHIFTHIIQSTPSYHSQGSVEPQRHHSPSRARNTGNTEEKSRTTAIILAFLLGCIGGHQFYLGNTGKGALYLFFCWTYIPAIIGFIEGIMLATQSDEDFYIKPKLLMQ